MGKSIRESWRDLVPFLVCTIEPSVAGDVWSTMVSWVTDIQSVGLLQISSWECSFFPELLQVGMGRLGFV